MELKTNLEELKANFITKANESLKDITIEHRNLKTGKIISVDEISYCGEVAKDITVLVKFKTETKQLHLIYVLEHNVITVFEEDLEKINEVLAGFRQINEIDIENLELKEEKERKAQEKAKAKEAEEAKLKKIEARRLANEKKMKQRAKDLSNSSLKIGDGLFVALGYIAKHAKKIFAQLPDYLNNWFSNEFPEADTKFVKLSNSKHICPSGLPSTYALALQIDLDTNNNMPEYLKQYIGNTKKEIQPISNTEFVFGILKKYGFQFGKTQDLEKILDTIPNSELNSFNIGLALE